MTPRPRTKGWLMLAVLALAAQATASTATEAAGQETETTLAQAIQTALRNHGSLRVSQANLELAEAQYQQAMAAFRPRVNLEAGFQRADQDRTFSFDGTVMTPAMALPLGPGGALVPIPGQPLPINMEVKMFERDTTKASVNLSFPLYTGGKKEALAAMAQTGVALARQDQRKTEIELVRDVSKYYHGAQMAAQMAQLATDTLARFEVLESLTERLYTSASLKVKKTDYLRGKTTTALARSMVQETAYATTLTRSALANAMGLPPGSEAIPAQATTTAYPDHRLDELINDAMLFNPDKQRMELALQASDHKIAQARSGYMPMVGIDASAYQIWNSYAKGLFNDANRTGWTIALGVKWDVFDGGMARAEVDHAQAAKLRLEAQKVLLDNGLALQIKEALLRIQRSRAQLADTTQAQGFAAENRKLNVRAYQEELVETKDVIEAQLVESFASASALRARHEELAATADLDYLIGKAAQMATQSP